MVFENTSDFQKYHMLHLLFPLSDRRRKDSSRYCRLRDPKASHSFQWRCNLRQANKVLRTPCATLDPCECERMRHCLYSNRQTRKDKLFLVFENTSDFQKYHMLHWLFPLSYRRRKESSCHCRLRDPKASHSFQWRRNFRQANKVLRTPCATLDPCY